VAFIPDDKGVDSLARQIKMTGRAYPLFEIAQMVLQKPERYSVTLTTKKKPDGTVTQPLFVCALDETVWLAEDEAVRWALDKHFETFYQPEKTQIEPPKGTYTFVAQCGLSGVILGPPNYHDYQNRLHKLHADRFANLPFEVYKTRVRIVKDEAVVKKWIDDQSWKIEYVCLNLPEPLKLGSRDEVEQHFRQLHLPNIIKPAETARLNGLASRTIRSSGLARLIRQNWEDQRHFPLQVATILSQQFAARGLQFFKVNKTVTHVAVARPHFLDMELTPVSEGVKRIVDYINTHPKRTRRDVVEALAPTPPAPALPALLPVPAPEPAAPVAPAPEGSAEPAPGIESAPVEAAAAAPPPVPEVSEPEPTSEQTMVIADLHWLIHQGHVIEFANGMLETAKKPIVKPPRPAPPPAAPAGQAGVAPVAPADQTGAPPVEAPAPVEPPPPEAQPAFEAAPVPDLATGAPETPTTLPSAEEKPEAQSIPSLSPDLGATPPPVPSDTIESAPKPAPAE
jgi:hypothetical protein